MRTRRPLEYLRASRDQARMLKERASESLGTFWAKAHFARDSNYNSRDWPEEPTTGELAVLAAERGAGRSAESIFAKKVLDRCRNRRSAIRDKAESILDKLSLDSAVGSSSGTRGSEAAKKAGGNRVKHGSDSEAPPLLPDVILARLMRAIGDEGVFDKRLLPGWTIALRLLPERHAWWSNELLHPDLPRCGSDTRKIAVKYVKDQIPVVRRTLEEALAKRTAVGGINDPAECCFALASLINLGYWKSGSGSKKKFGTRKCAACLQASCDRCPDASGPCLFGEHAHQHIVGVLRSNLDLTENTLDAVCSSIDSRGLLPYGQPILYQPENGKAAFATSYAAYRTLVGCLADLLSLARKRGYDEPIRALIEEWFLCEDGSVRRLLEVPHLIARHEQEVKPYRGWASDRAPQKDERHVESWVTVDVLFFAADMERLAQELLQYEVLGHHSARTLPGELKRWVNPDEGMAEKENCGKWLSRHLITPGLPRAQTILLFGPPGTGKTEIAKYVAGELGWHFLELSPAHFIADGLERMQATCETIFEDLRDLRETVVLLDEMDSLLIRRELIEPGGLLSFFVPGMLPTLAAFTKHAEKNRVIVFVNSNFRERLDPAVVRSGRFDKHLMILPPTREAQRRFLKKRNVGTVPVALAGATFADLRAKTSIDSKITAGAVLGSVYRARMNQTNREDVDAARRMIFEEIDALRKRLPEGSPPRKEFEEQLKPKKVGSPDSDSPSPA